MNPKVSIKDSNLHQKETLIYFGSLNPQDVRTRLQPNRVILPADLDKQLQHNFPIQPDTCEIQHTVKEDKCSVSHQPSNTSPSVSETSSLSVSSDSKKKASKWSDLFDRSKPVGNGIAIHENGAVVSDDNKLSLKELLSDASITWNSASIRPRGLNNKDNKCFLNVTLQSLIACPPFLNLLTKISSANIQENDFPTLCRFVRFRREFGVLESGTPTKTSVSSSNLSSAESNKFVEIKQPKEKKQTAASTSTSTTSSTNSRPFTPDYFYDLLTEFNPMSSLWHEDSQEFLCFVLEKLHGELTKVIEDVSTCAKATPTTIANNDDDRDEWEEVGKKNKSTIVITKEDAFKESIITDIFGGKLRSVLRIKGQKSTSSIQPFYCIHLEVNDQRVTSVEDSLQLHMKNEFLDDFLDPEKKTKVRASKQITIESLPRVLILHLKRFSFGHNGVEKIHKFISYPEILTIRPSWLVNERKYSPQERTYSLFSVVTHHGKKAAGGHYTCDIKQANGDWLLFDDSRVSKISRDDVLNRRAYLLFYYATRN
jgi:ubiquitin carboxyl-terminal hydrolase 10